jgi:WhiB family redox-sensing transcriptional regulator
VSFDREAFLAWRSQAKCLGAGNEPFFPDRGEPLEWAQKVCGGCRVREQCREHGLRHEKHGIWGGLSERERRRIRRERGIACHEISVVEFIGGTRAKRPEVA